MKSIVFTAQNVRDFLKARTLTVKKSSHDLPFENGDVVFIREPWYRLRDPRDGGESDRFNYASNATAEPALYKWASPVSMPAAAIRYYGKVTAVFETPGTAGEWEIMLETISKAEADARETGLPYSDAEDEEHMSDYYTYAGDMSPEEYEKMQAAIDSDRARLKTVRARRREILGNQNGPADIIAAELKEIEREEREIVAALEDAGVHDTNAGGLSEANTAEGEEPAETVQEAEEHLNDESPPAVTFGTCKYCGQLINIGPGYSSQRDGDAAAADICDCYKAKSERRVLEQIGDARERVEQLFGESASELSFKPIDEPEPVALLDNIVELIARRFISSATIQIRGYCKAKISLTTKAKIKVERSEARSYQLEAGE